MKLSRFKALTHSYGAQLEKWPEDERAKAEELLRTSAQARLLMDEARMLDDALKRAGARFDAAVGISTDDQAALAQLRAGVLARISRAPAHRHRLAWPVRWVPRSPGGGAGALPFPGLALATSSVLALAVGVLIGWLQAPKPMQVDVLALLEAAPLHVLTH
jgi:hypothetical protein